MTEENIKTIQSYIEKFNNISSKYKDYEDILGIEEVNNLVRFSDNFKRDAESIIEENRKLRIGVIGQIKAGKSSFINSLIFEGKELLPKAATPMTAALTVISYKEKPCAEIEFFSEKEWSLIRQKAVKYDEILETEKERMLRNNLISSTDITVSDIKYRVNIPKEIEIAKELVEMANKSSINIYDYLGKRQIIDEVDTIEDLVGKLNDYVGANGLFTPIVKSSYLYVNIDSVKNIEIIDTPGINDPIISRGEKTREYIGKCDVVFMLSYASQFMDSSDIGLLTQNVPNKGIKNVVLLASKFDSALIDESYKYKGFIETAKGVANKLNNQANEVVIPILRRNPDNKLLQSLKNCLPPKFISSISYNIAVNYDSMNKEESFILNRLRETFPDFEFNPDNLKSFSNIDNIKNKEYKKIADKKEQIIEQRFNNLVVGQQQEYKQILGDLLDNTKRNLVKLTDFSENELKEQHKVLKKEIEKARNKVDIIFDTNITRIKIQFQELLTELKGAALYYQKINEQTASRKEYIRTERYGFLWLKKRDIFETVTYSYANIYQAIDQVNEFVIEAQRSLQQEFKKIVNMSELSDKLKQAVLDVFDLSDENFDFEEVIYLVQKVVNKISIPDININSNKYSRKIEDSFNNEKVEGSDIKKLKSLQREVIGNILTDIENTIKCRVDDIVKYLENTSENFINNIIRESEEKIEEITKQIREKEVYMERYNTVIGMLENDLRNLI